MRLPGIPEQGPEAMAEPLVVPAQGNVIQFKVGGLTASGAITAVSICPLVRSVDELATSKRAQRRQRCHFPNARMAPANWITASEALGDSHISRTEKNPLSAPLGGGEVGRGGGKLREIVRDAPRSHDRRLNRSCPPPHLTSPPPGRRGMFLAERPTPRCVNALTAERARAGPYRVIRRAAVARAAWPSPRTTSCDRPAGRRPWSRSAYRPWRPAPPGRAPSPRPR